MGDVIKLQDAIKKQKMNYGKQSSIQQELTTEVYSLLEKIFEKTELQDIGFKISIEYEKKSFLLKKNLEVVVEVLDLSKQMNMKTGNRTILCGEFLEVENEEMKTNDVKSFVDCEEEN